MAVFGVGRVQFNGLPAAGLSDAADDLSDAGTSALCRAPEGANHLWRNPSRELSIGLVADEQLFRVTGGLTIQLDQKPTS
jgi:surface antigen